MAEGKANTVAHIDAEPVQLPLADGNFIDGRYMDLEEGGVFVGREGAHYGLAHPDVVPASTNPIPEGHVAKNRFAGPITIQDKSEPVSGYGAELELLFVEPETGETLDIEPGMQNELYSFMHEKGTAVTRDKASLQDAYVGMLHDFRDYAERIGGLVLPTSVLGQREPSSDDLTVNPYVRYVVDQMTEQTGFDTLSTFRVCGAQEHTEITNAHAALQAGETMQYLNPILMTAGLAGPFLRGPLAEQIAQDSFTDKQRQHLGDAMLRKQDVHLGQQSYRYLLRRMGSPSAGVWARPAPDSIEEYFETVNGQLRDGQLNTPDRVMGMHTDRMRFVLDGSGASTFEGCSSDTFLGNPRTLYLNHALRSALFTSLEAAAMRGASPREDVARLLGIDGLRRQQRLNRAHRLSLAASRQGNDAKLYKHQKPGELVDTLFAIADLSPTITLDDQEKTEIRKMFAGTKATHTAMRQTGDGTPTIDSYFTLGIGNPATYMTAQYQELRRESRTYRQPGDNAALVRMAELATAQAFMNMDKAAILT